MPDEKRQGRISISVRLILAIIGFSTFIAIFTTALQLFLDYRRDLDRVQSDFAYVQVVSLRSLSTTLWDMEEENVQQQLDSIANHPGIDYAAIRIKDRIAWTSGTEPKGGTIRAEYPLVHERANFKQNLGRLQIITGLSAIYQNLVEKALVILGTNFLKTLTVAAFMYVLFHAFFARHLVALSDYARNLDLRDLAKPLRFRRIRIEGKRRDEFDDIAQAMNQMWTKLKASYDELTESEESFRQLTENIRDVFWMTDPVKDRMLYISPGYEDIWGRTRNSLYEEPKSFLDAIDPEDRPRVIAAMALQAEGTYDETYRIIRPDGTLRWIRDRAFPVRNENEEVYRIAGIAEDITEIVEQNEQLQQAQKMEVVGQLTGGIAHDFNNILAVGMGNVELAEEAARKGGDVQPFLETIKRAQERAASLTNKLLAFSRKQTLFPQVIEAGKLVGGMTGLLRSSLGETIEIRVTGDDDLWPCKVDPSLLESAVLNLALNARDAMPGGGTLTIQTANISLDDDYAAAQSEVVQGEYVLVAITDTGTGMPQDVIDHAFDPFFTTKEVGRGTGLGLSMVYGFVKQSGGYVTINSEEGVGTTIKLYLPRSDKAGEYSTRADHREDVPQANGETVLVVEDDPDVRSLSVAMLGSFGYEILEAADGKTALEALESAPNVNLLFTDVVLPGGMSGPQLAAEVQHRLPGIAVLYTSGYTELANFDEGTFGEDTELLQKPFRKADLARKVRQALDQERS